MLRAKIHTLMQALLGCSRLEREMAEELRLHLERRTEDLVTRFNLTREEALRRARIEFGSMEKYREEGREARGLRWFNESRADLKYALRMLRKNPIFTLASIAILGLGIGANTAVFSIIDAVFLKPLPFKDSDRLVMVWEEASHAGLPRADVAPLNFLDWKEQSDAFDDLAAYVANAFNLTGEGTPERLDGAGVTTNLFPLLGIKPFLGRWFQDSEGIPGHENVTILSYGLWQRRFGGNPSIVGRSIFINDQSHIVVGVMPARFQFPRENTQLWMPAAFTRTVSRGGRDVRFLNVVGRLKPSVSWQEAEGQVQTIARRLAELYPDTNKNFGAVVVPLRQEFVRDVRTSLWLLLAASLLVLLIACANVANMLVTRGIGRKREIAARSTIGASRARVARQLFVEGLLLSTFGGIVGVLIATAAMRLLESLIPPALAGAVYPSLDVRLLGFAILISLFTGTAFGLAPLRETFRLDLIQALRESAPTGGTRGRSHAVLVSFETALAVVILASTGLVVRTLLKIQAVDPGFRSESVQTLRLELSFPQYRTVQQKVGFYREVLDRVRSLPSVVSAGFTTFLPYTNFQGATAVFVEGRPDLRSSPPIFWRREVTADYLQTIRVPLRAGRWFSEQDDTDHPLVAIISESAARLFQGDPIGKRFMFGGQGLFTVVGIVGDIREEALELPAQRPAVYTPVNQIQQNWFFNPRDLAIRVQGDPTAIADAVQREIWSINRNQTISRVRTLENVVDQQIAGRKVHATLLSTFSILSVLLAALGIYALLSFVVEAKGREFGIRMAVGACARDLVVSVLRQSLLWISTGALAGLTITLIITRSFSTLLYGVEPTDPLTLSGSVLLLFAVGLAAACVPAWRATRVDPMIALRHE